MIERFEPSEWASVGEAAHLADVSRHWMRALARDGRVRSFEISGQVFVSRADASAYVREPDGGRGRPRLAKKGKKGKRKSR